MKQNSKDILDIKIVTHKDGKDKVVEFQYRKSSINEKTMALDVLLQAQDTILPNLAFRYGCRARNCGVCTIDINNLPRIACRSVVRNVDVLKAMNTLPVLSDLVVKRDNISRQLRGKLKTNTTKNDLNVEAPKEYHELTACIECYACLEKCPMHEKNSDDLKPNYEKEYKWGNPFTLLKLQTVILDPLTSKDDVKYSINSAIDFGLEKCLDCHGCKCGVGIDLKGKVIKPLVEKSGLLK